MQKIARFLDVLRSLAFVEDEVPELGNPRQTTWGK
jgi:hypothetical protein